MLIFPLSEQNWTLVRTWSARAAGVNPEMAAVLTITGSLTRYLERRHGMRLSLRLHEQFVDTCGHEEAWLLGSRPGDPCLRRRVSLLYRGTVMFDAESVLPLDGLPAELAGQLEEGVQPLGDLLIDRGLSLSRSDLSVAEVVLAGGAEKRWARRSVLRSPSGTRALVVECFHAAMWRRLKSLARHRQT